MGYNSSGAVRIVGPKDQMLAQLVALKLADQDQEGLEEALKECKLVQSTDEEALMLGWEINGKWYDTYADVQAFSRIWDHFADMEDFTGSWVRIGEEDSDVEQKHFGDDPWQLVDYVRTYAACSLEGDNLLMSLD